ncbi:hypothetical protein HanXRQr2_Chr05g0202771 [Helianthus annuus]|uniref:Uncharacterized protein n=1 Tax=Helianthus annuus TaxID=4232 RepID=A0A251UMT9_HELAN|nr:hypothetical protein HanXRQr2_Chr05g0202771 [Helianthus annuus]
MKAKTGSQQRTHIKQLFTISFPLDCGSNICYTPKYCFYQHLLTYNCCSIQGLMKTKSPAVQSAALSQALPIMTSTLGFTANDAAAVLFISRNVMQYQ